MSAIYQLPLTTTRRYFLWSFAGDYLGTCFGRSGQDAREKFAAIHDTDPKRVVARVCNTFRPSQL
mgnify:CR=1 FL=1